MTVHILQHGLKNKVTHYYSETAEYTAALKVLGLDYVVYVHQNCEAEIVQEFNAKPVFPYAPDTLLDSNPVTQEMSQYITLGESFADTLINNLPKKFTANDLIYVPYGSQNEAYALMRWLQKTGIYPFPKIAIFCHRPEIIWQTSEDRTQTVASPTFWRWPGHFFRPGKGPSSTYLVTCSDRLARVLNKLSELPALVTGLATSLAMELERATAHPKNIDVGLIGTFRPERGSTSMAAILLQIDQVQSGLTYLVQTTHETEKQSLMTELNERGFQGHMEFAVGALTTMAYTAQMVRCKLLLLPYAPPRYALRSSGVLSEAASYGIPVVVPGQTWMADAIESGRVSGMIFAKFNTHHIARATVASLKNLATLREKALALAPAWREQNNAQSNLKAIFKVLKIPFKSSVT